MFILNLPAQLAAIWFPTNELTLATSIALSGMFIGHALGFMITPKIVLGPLEEQ